MMSVPALWISEEQLVINVRDPIKFYYIHIIYLLTTFLPAAQGSSEGSFSLHNCNCV